MTTIYDYIIIGSGIAGLYSAYILKKNNPDTNILILEKNDYIGGRAGNKYFYGTRIVTGAGIVRKDKDTLLMKLIKELNVTYYPFVSKISYSKKIKTPINVVSVIKHLRSIYRKSGIIEGDTFKTFAIRHLGEDKYKLFKICAGYTDYQNDDVYDALYNYGFDDNISGWKGVSISWNELIDKLVEFIGHKTIKLNNCVSSINITDNQNYHILHTIENNTYITKKIIVATTIDTVQHLFPEKTIYKQIHGQPFLRIYAKFNKKSSELMKKYLPNQTIVDSPLHKLIPMNHDKGVHMIGYTDNRAAIYFKNKLENTNKNKRFYERLLENSLDIPNNSLTILDITSFYWSVGTHYYEPLRDYKTRDEFIKVAQHPYNNIYVVGEMISKNQGWVNGALESVNSINIT